MDPTTISPTIPELIATWRSAIQDMEDVCEPLSEDQWRKPTPCPGWTVGDVVAHTADVESFMAGEPRPEHAPDWEALPHATGPFGQFTEVGVDYRRSWPKDAVLAELRSRADDRRAQVASLPADAQVPGVTGKLVPLPRMIRTRTFDVWVHEQDIRAAIGEEGHWGTAPAVVAFQQMAGALPYVWAKGVGAPASAVVHLTITGPELEADLFATIDEEGKGVASSPAQAATVHLTLSWPDYMRLSSGRVDVTDSHVRGRIMITGDADLAESLLEELTITP